ncbi:hypothetical protein [Gelidibacter japonicus]|uniref:hypothetical protein n=1 Tax=Gelidibacter japonicus TaxID=1962232 RepID=UPI0013D271CD|nr:hypothetical protein [Gelidibacter japonicus]
MQETILEAFEELKAETQKIHSEETLTDWKNKAVNIIVRVYGIDSKPEKQINALSYTWYMDGGDNTSKRKTQAFNLMDGLIKEINRFGLPEKMILDNDKMNINITQNTNQSTKINLSLIIETIQDELNGKQLKEIQEIIQSEENTENKKNKIVDKLKKFGSDVATNIVAGILTNPNIYG